MASRGQGGHPCLRPLLQVQPAEVAGGLDPQLVQHPGDPVRLGYAGAHDRSQQLVFICVKECCVGVPQIFVCLYSSGRGGDNAPACTVNRMNRATIATAMKLCMACHV